MTFLLVVLVGSSFLMVAQLNGNVNQNKRVLGTYSDLVLAKQALIAYAVTYPDVLDSNGDPLHVDGQGNRFGPGYLPCPDRHSESSINFGYSGNSDVVPSGSCSLSGGTSIGRFPWRTLDINPMYDSSGEHFWYALSDSFRNNPKTYPLNSETAGELIVDGRTDIVAVIIAPGETMSGQDRSDANFNDITKFLEGLNQQTGSFIRNFETTQADDFNDVLIAVTREEIMEMVEKRVLSEFRGSIDNYREQEVNVTTGNANLDYRVFSPVACNTTYDPNTCQPVYLFKFPWLSPFAPPSLANPLINGTADSGSNELALVDNDLDFTNLGIAVNDIVQNTTDGTLAVVNSVNTNSLNLSTWDDSNNQFDIDEDDTYQIPRFNGIEGTQQGHLPYHEDDEAFLTSYTFDWTALESNLAVVAVDTLVTHAHHQDSMKSAIETSTGTTSSGISVDFNSGSCVWSDISSAECFGRYIDEQFLRGTAASGTGVSSGNVTLVDAARNFTSAGIKRGDLLDNYSAMSAIASMTGSATAGSGNNLLEDTGQNFLAAAIVPHYFVVEKDNKAPDEIGIGIILQVTATTLTLASADKNNDIVFTDTDDYTIRPIVKAVVTSVGNVSDDTLEGVEIAGAASLDFDIADDYRIRVASKTLAGVGTWPTPSPFNNSYILYDSGADFSAVRVGDVFENTTLHTLGVVTAKGVDGSGTHWVAHTPLQGSSVYDDIIYGESYTIYHNYIDKRQYDINVKMTSGHSEVKAVNGEKVRDLCLDIACSGGTIGYNNNEPMLTLRDFDQDETEVGVSTLTIPTGGITGNLKLAGLHMDLIKDTDLPQWVFDNEWHHLMYLAFSDDLSPDYTAGLNCQTDSVINCLQISGPGNVENNIQSLVINAGSANAGQNRTIGAISDYFELGNSDNDVIFDQTIESNTFNDQIYVLQSIQ